MIIGVGVDGRYGFSAAEHREIARSAAALGFGSLWSNAVTIPDAFHVCARWAEAAAGRLRTGISVVNALNWKPQSLAGQAATVSLLSGGRFTLGIGTGGAGVAQRPIATMADYLAVLRPLLDGEEVVYRGRTMDLDRSRVAGLLGFDGFIEHTRDAMWQVDGLIAAMSAASSLLTTQSKLAEDLEIWASTEFDYVSIADGYSRASVLMPQKRNPYSLSIIRGASGTLIGRLTGFLAVSKSPSARSDNLIYAYGEVPRALDLALRTTRLTAGVIATLEVNAARMWQALESGFSQSTDLAEFIMQQCAVDYRTAYQIVGIAVRKASRDGIRGIDLTAGRLQDAAAEYNGSQLDLDDASLAAVLDPRGIVETRVLAGGAAPQVVAGMAERCRELGERLFAEAGGHRAATRAAETDLVNLATKLLAEESRGEAR